jgi:hypothetical protein
VRPVPRWPSGRCRREDGRRRRPPAGPALKSGVKKVLTQPRPTRPSSPFPAVTGYDLMLWIVGSRAMVNRIRSVSYALPAPLPFRPGHRPLRPEGVLLPAGERSSLPTVDPGRRSHRHGHRGSRRRAAVSASAQPRHPSAGGLPSDTRSASPSAVNITPAPRRTAPALRSRPNHDTGPDRAREPGHRPEPAHGRDPPTTSTVAGGFDGAAWPGSTAAAFRVRKHRGRAAQTV